MIGQLMLGSLLITGTIIISVVMIGLAVEMLTRYAEANLSEGRHRIKPLLALSATTSWFVFVVTVNVWLWAIAYVSLGVFAEFEEALYFSLVAFTTLGFGDIILRDEWRLLSGFTATGGFILFGLGTAFLFEVVTQLFRRARED